MMSAANFDHFFVVESYMNPSTAVNRKTGSQILFIPMRIPQIFIAKLVLHFFVGLEISKTVVYLKVV